MPSYVGSDFHGIRELKRQTMLQKNHGVQEISSTKGSRKKSSSTSGSGTKRGWGIKADPIRPKNFF